MLKVCTNCDGEYYARWRNEPTTLCPDCRADTIVCDTCRAIVKPPVDAAQLSLWPALGPPRRRFEPVREPHFSHGRMASQAEKRKYPYQ